MIFVDSGAFVAWYVRNDRHHEKAVREWRVLGATGEKCVTSSLVISESMTLVGRRAGYRFAAERGRGLLESRLLEILRPSAADELAALDYFEKFADQEASFTDCVSFVLMKAHRIRRVFGFDRDFDVFDFERFPLS